MSRQAALVAVAFALIGFCGFGARPCEAREFQAAPDASTIRTIGLADLPPEAVHTLQLIGRGGPFAYPHKDGSIFGNFEKRLPQRERGYYREYTVATPGRGDRGARRIVAGGEPAFEYFYTADHYRSWYRIVQP